MPEKEKGKKTGKRYPDFLTKENISFTVNFTERKGHAINLST